MELLFESRLNLKGIHGQINFVQHQPKIHPEPVLKPDTHADGKGVTIYGSVHRDSGKLRMWYQAIPAEWKFDEDMASVGYAESDDGIHWIKPKLNLVKYGTEANNLTNLGLHSATVFIDPDSPPSHRYRATGCGYKELYMCPEGITDPGYYTAHSADGLNWKLDMNKPRWYSADVITNCYHPWQKRAIISMKYTPRVGRFYRRSIHHAEFRNGVYSEPVSALYADEFEDICAVNRGHTSCDYYGMGMMPAGSGTVGFLWKFWHDLPYTRKNSPFALWGTCDITLVYQPDPGGRWFHIPGRPIFIDHTANPWTNGWINSASCVVEVKDEQRLYFSGVPITHGFYLNEEWKPINKWTEWTAKYGYPNGGIGFVSWPKYRLFGFESSPYGELTIDLGVIEKPSELFLNYQTKPGGAVFVEQLDNPKRTQAESIPLSGDAISEKVAWKDGTIIQPSQGKKVLLKLCLNVASVYAYDIHAI